MLSTPRRRDYTLSHEHLLCDLWLIIRNYDGILDDETLAAGELKVYLEAGGSTLVDATSGGLGRNPLALKRISEETGAHSIMGPPGIGSVFIRVLSMSGQYGAG